MRKKLQLTAAFILLMTFGFVNVITAQEQVTNGDLEAWDNSTTPSNYDKAENITQETGVVYAGTYSAKQQAGTSDLMQNVGGIVAGQSYTISYYYLDNDVDARSRIWSYWTSGGSTLGDNAAELRSSIYSTDDPAWQLWTVTLVAPATADGFKFEVRSYNDNAGGGFIYYDDLSVFGGGAATPTISKAYAISDTELEVLYTVDVTSVSAGDYSLTGTSAITFSSATIDGSNAKLVHLTGPSVNMVGDITVDNIADAGSSSNYDFYAGIMPISNTNPTNPGGIIDNVHFASYLGIISANDGYNNVWISDAAGERNGVMIFDYNFDGSVSVGDEIIVSAARTTYNGLTELVTPDLISINSSGNTPYGPTIIDGSDINATIPVDTDPAEKWEGQLVKIENVTVDSYVDYEYTCSWSDGSNSYTFYLRDNVDYHLNNVTLNVGSTYASITGVVDWYNSGPYYSINPRNQADILSTGPADARIVGSMNGWSTTDPDYVMTVNTDGLYVLTKSLNAGTHEYKVLEGDVWGDPEFPALNEPIVLTATEDVTWKANITTDFVMHTLPVMVGDFMSEIGGTDWEPTDLMGEMTDPDADETYTLELTIPAGNWFAKVTLNHDWNQNTGGDIAFEADGVTPTTFTFDFLTNTTTISGPPPPTATITFIVNDVTNMNYDGFFLKGSWDGNGQYDPSWGGGMEHSEFYDDGTHGDVTADDNIWTCQQDLVVDAGSNTWEWGVNDSESNWIAGNWQFAIPDQTAQTLTWVLPDVVDLVINEIMYNSPGYDEEWIELYNNTDQTINLENYDICDNDASHTHIIIPAGYSVAPGEFFTISIATDGAFPFTPDYDGTGNFALNNGGDAVRVWNPSYILVDVVNYDDSDPWPSSPDGDGPTLSLIHHDLDNSLAESWAPSNQDGGTPGAFNFPIVLTAPNGGELIELGSVFDIEWTVEGWDGSIKIELLQEGLDPVLIVSNLPVANQSFAWSVFGAEVASDYKIQVTNMDDDNPFDASDDFFSILEEYIMPEIVITEIMYNPPESGTDSLEFLELYNNGDETVNLEGFYFTEGIEFTFPSVDLLPDNYLLVSVNSAAMMSTFGVDALQWTAGGLSNGGEDIVLRDSYDIIIDSLTYDDHLPWDTLADGFGPSLTLCNPDVDNSVAENWTHSVNFAAVNSVGDSIWATPGFGCQIEFLAGFEADVTVVSVGESVLFTDLTIGDPIEWTWTFEGGTPDTYFGQTPPPVFYDTEGDWDVTLLVTDGTNTDEITYVDYISVLDFPAPTNLVGVVGPYDDVQLTWDGFATLGFEDDFESYDDFVLEFMPWTNVDVDGSTTYGMTDVDWPNAYAEQSFIIFNPAQTTPPVDDIIPHSGDKLAACFAATAPPNDDWLMTPLVGIGSGFNLTFWAKSYTADYGLERFRVGVSTTGLDPGDFTIISEGDYVEAPVEEWTEFTYDLSAYDGQNIYVAVQCVSNDAFILLVDDFYIGASKSHIAFNSNEPVIGKGTKSVSFTSTPSNYVAATTTGRGVAAELLGYNVYRDDVQINAAIVEVTEYNDAEPTIGSHDYFVTAVYDGGESDPSNVVSIVVTDINDVTSTSVAIYPNPTNGIFTIEYAAEKTADIVVMDITGKEVYTSTFIGTTQVNLLGLQKGLYLVRLLDKSTNEIIVKKLLVK